VVKLPKIIFSGTNSKDLAKKIARKAKAKYGELYASHFPDGETYLRFKTSVKGKEVVLVNTLYPNPNENMVELVFAAHTAKELGAKKVTIVAPYLAYMRQDKRFHAGECKSNTIMSKLLGVADRVITIDPHLHRIKSMKEIFRTQTKKLSANEVIAEHIKKNMKNVMIVGPDSESDQWAETIAKHLKTHATVLKKKRYTARKVRIIVKKGVDFKGKNVVIVDDIISTGNTMIEPIKQIKRMGAKSVYCICVHGLFVEGALKKMKKLGVHVLSTNTITNPVSKIDISKLIADSL